MKAFPAIFLFYSIETAKRHKSSAVFFAEHTGTKKYFIINTLFREIDLCCKQHTAVCM